MTWNFMTLFEGIQNRWILFVRNFEILVPFWIDTGLLIKLCNINPIECGWKNFGEKVRNGKTKSHQIEEEADSTRKGRAGQLGEYV